MSVQRINDCLDELNQAEDRRTRVRILKHMQRRTTALEQKWLVRIILKQLKIGVYGCRIVVMNDDDDG